MNVNNMYSAVNIDQSLVSIILYKLQVTQTQRSKKYSVEHIFTSIGVLIAEFRRTAARSNVVNV